MHFILPGWHDPCKESESPATLGCCSAIDALQDGDHAGISAPYYVPLNVFAQRLRKHHSQIDREEGDIPVMTPDGQCGRASAETNRSAGIAQVRITETLPNIASDNQKQTIDKVLSQATNKRFSRSAIPCISDDMNMKADQLTIRT